MSFAVVKFLKDSDNQAEIVSEVPLSWLSKNQTHCKWPSDKHVGIYINKNCPPQDDWEEYRVEVECFCGTCCINYY